MASVETVNGQLPTEDLGQVLMHEHVFILTPELVEDYPDTVGWRGEAQLTEAIDSLQRAKAAGIDTVVDLTVVPMGRDVDRIRRVSQASGMNIVVSTGLYTYDELPRFFEFFGPGARFERPEPMVEMFVHDIVSGIGDSGIKAGMLKCATDAAGVTPGVERVLRAVARAHLETGAPISTHTDAHTERGLEQQAVFAEEGVDLTRVVIGHSGDSTDLDYLRRLADRGSYLGMDRFGLHFGQLDFEARVSTVTALCELGYADQMVLSHDASCWNNWLPHNLTTAAEFNQPDWHYCHIPGQVLPALRERGVSEAQLNAMLVGNPARILGYRA